MNKNGLSSKSELETSLSYWPSFKINNTNYKGADDPSEKKSACTHMTDNLITQSTDIHFEICDVTYTTVSQPLTQICLTQMWLSFYII